MAEFEWDKEGSEIVEKLTKQVLPSLLEGVNLALSEVFSKAKFFIDFQTLSRYILLALEEKVRLPDEVKAKLLDELKNIYQKTQIETVPYSYSFNIKDERAINYALKLHDFYLGKFFQGDRQIRLRALNWMSRYYLEKGNPIGKGQKGIKEFLDEFGSYIKPQTEWKTRQIIDTSVNYLRNSARLRALEKARITYYRWDAVGDRLTCRVCRSLDGRVFKTAEAIRILDTIEASEDPTLIKELKPFLSKPWTGATRNCPIKTPPCHPHCRCRIAAEEEEVTIPTTVETVLSRKHTGLAEEFQALTPKERENKIKAHLGSSWLRAKIKGVYKGKPVSKKGGVNDYKKNKAYFRSHFLDHKNEFNIDTLEEYEKITYEVIKNPDEVFVERTEGETFFIFKKGDTVVISNDDVLRIVSCYKLNKPFDTWLKERIRDEVIRLL